MSVEKAKELISKRDEIDSQLIELHQVLKANNVDMETPLVDQEGFPVAELDIVSIRKARHSIICLTNDRKKLTDEIEAMIYEVHENARMNLGQNNDASAKTSDAGMSDIADKTGNDAMHQADISAVHRTSNKPFLRIENVVYGSPAFYGGLVIDDIVVQCGPVYADNFNGLQGLSEVINNHVGKAIQLTILRNSTVHKVTVHPGKWDGAGVFGARFAVLKDDQSD